ncbi:MAG TPA: metalloregulator ArsR/SmtB family transcription factor [Fimbriimonadaceae bacterium]|nr:metalloregulator ArsR/SmtB family transcription factor [Fimbriimonadaceae bacterium]
METAAASGERTSGILEVRGAQGADLFRALGNETRSAILGLLASGEKNVNELCSALGLAQPTITKHVQLLEQAGLITSEYRAGLQGMQKRCRLRYHRIITSFDVAESVENPVEEISMPIGLYTLAHPHISCGLANTKRIIGFIDVPQSFFDPDRASAQILWMHQGFVEYMFPCTLPTSVTINRLELMMEICSEAPNNESDYPSDITVWVNGVEVGTWTSPGDFGGKRGALNPDWWIDHMTQYGMLKIWSVDSEGAYVDGTRISGVGIESLLLAPQQPITVRIGIKPDAEHIGGFNLFGSGFGNYAHDLVLRLGYESRHEPVRRTSLPYAMEGGQEG